MMNFGLVFGFCNLDLGGQHFLNIAVDAAIPEYNKIYLNAALIVLRYIKSVLLVYVIMYEYYRCLPITADLKLVVPFTRTDVFKYSYFVRTSRL